MEVLGSDILVLGCLLLQLKILNFCLVWKQVEVHSFAVCFLFNYYLTFIIILLSFSAPPILKKKKADLTVSWAQWGGLIKVLPYRGYVFPFCSWTLGPDGHEEQGWGVMCPGPRASWGSFMLHRFAEQLSCPLCCWLRSASPGAKHGPLPGIRQTDSEI